MTRHASRGKSGEWLTEDTKSIDQVAKSISSLIDDGWQFVSFVTQNDRFVILMRRETTR